MKAQPPPSVHRSPAVEEQDSPPESPAQHEEDAAAATGPADDEDYDGGAPSHALPPSLSAAAARAKGQQAQKEQEDEEEEEEDHMEVDLEQHRRPRQACQDEILASITGSQKISNPTTIVVSGIAKMFVGELIETARVVMTERKDSGPIRPCRIREAYRRLKFEDPTSICS